MAANQTEGTSATSATVQHNNIIPQNGENVKSYQEFSIEDLKKLPVWVNWKPEERDGKQTKVPYNPRTGGRAQSNNSSTWTDFDFAISKSENIGFNFADNIAGIDIDNKQRDPELDKQAETILALFADTYAEKSPSGTGWHIIFRFDKSKIPTGADGKLDGKYYTNNPNINLECYFPGLTKKYFTFTGQGNGKNIEDMTEQVLTFLDNYMLRENFKRKKDPEKPPPSKNISADVDIIDKIRQSKQGYKFSALFDRGDASGYNGDDSAADQALCNILAWWLQGDFSAIDGYFRQSRLYREKWERVDYRTSTINNAIESCNGQFKNQPGRPKKEKPKKEYTPDEQDAIKKIVERFGVLDDEKLTISAVAYYLEKDNISVKYNETVRKTEIIGLNRYNKDYIVENLPIIAYNDLNLEYKRCNVNIVMDFLKVITMENAYNPVLELIDGGKWDGVDRLPELFRIMRIDDGDRLSRTLVEKWLWQNISMLRNDTTGFGADGLLVLRGAQGIGKTSVARRLAINEKWFGEGLTLDVRNTDSVMEAVSYWICELGEIESTFKSDLNALKNFITRAKDKYRVPYGRTAEELPRRTSFIGTCNSDEYLIDETGNRRYWTVNISGDKELDLDALNKLDVLQLYLQINEKAKDDIQGFRLTWDERKQLEERNSRHEKPIKGELEIRDILFKAEQEKLTIVDMTATTFKDSHSVLRNYSVQQIGTALNKIGIEQTHTKEKGKKLRLYKLPLSTARVNPSDFKQFY